jgi:hypothetical protein
MKNLIILLTSIAVMAWAAPALGQSSSYGKPCHFYNIDKTVRAKLGEGEDAQYQLNSIKALWPVMLNGKECPKLQEAICKWLTDKDDIKQMDRAIEYTLYTDFENVPFGDNGPYVILDNFDNIESSYSSSTESIELKTLGKRFAVFHLFSYMYYAGAAHGMYVHNYITYDTELDKIVTLEDVLIDPELIRPHILKSINLKYDYTEEDLFLPEDGIMKIPSVWYFEEGFLHLVYQPYEIASFAQGDIDVPLFYPNDPNAPEYLTPYGKELMEESQAGDPW